MPHPTSTPSAPLLGHLAKQIREWAPFADMALSDTLALLAQAEQRYLAPGETLLAPGQGPVTHLYLVRQGRVRSHGAALGGGSNIYEAGDLLPVAALLARRAVVYHYEAVDDLFVWAWPAHVVEDWVRRNAVFADHLHRRMQTMLDKSTQAMRALYASQVLAEQSLETPLSQLARNPVVSCDPSTPLADVLRRMTGHQVGSVLVLGPAGEALGIFTRTDLPQVVLAPGFDLAQPIAGLMRSPLHTLSTQHTAQDAALLMGRYGIRHVPVTNNGRVVGLVSEHDLYALQRSTLQQVGRRIRDAQTTADLQAATEGVRQLARNLLAQGIQTRQLITLISHLNDQVVQRAVALEAAAAGVLTERLCWVAMGSEGRGEQTIATDQDNGLVLPDDTPAHEVERLRLWARGVNQVLDRCGFPLCKGGIMAGEPDCCLPLSEWRRRFTHWIDHGTPDDLLKAQIFFDMRAVAGDGRLVEDLRNTLPTQVAQTPRFTHLLAQNALAQKPALGWLGHLELDTQGGLNLKTQGAKLFVDAGRLWALAHGIAQTGTRERLEQAGAAMGLPTREVDGWVSSFDFLQGLRLRLQLGPPLGTDPNWLPVDTLSDTDRRLLVRALRHARTAQQRLEMDWVR
ncbi:MAG: hypothetical protein RJA09_861 [Pseudomonadota bacterium]